MCVCVVVVDDPECQLYLEDTHHRGIGELATAVEDARGLDNKTEKGQGVARKGGTNNVSCSSREVSGATQSAWQTSVRATQSGGRGQPSQRGGCQLQRCRTEVQNNSFNVVEVSWSDGGIRMETNGGIERPSLHGVKRRHGEILAAE